MGLYSRYILPRLIHMACALEPQMRQREKVVPEARGQVLEIGVGSGLNLTYYDPRRVDRLVAIDPSRELWSMAAERAAQVQFPLQFLPASAEAVPAPVKNRTKRRRTSTGKN
ncbi:MAG: class I SAM-dependent methyltransferase [Gemmatimonadota bacterium]